MTHIKRRHFLQGAGATLASIGLSQLDFFTQADRTAQALTQPTGRKLALLVGINNYGTSINSLRGCLTDVEMQYQLLRYRYGFQPSDILMLTDGTPQKPTRDNILRAFEEHLIKQAKPDDVVVFHFSGHGSLVYDDKPIDLKDNTNGTLIPADCRLDKRNDIMGKTLFLLTSQLKTDNFTMVLDSCHSGGSTRNDNIVVRALAPGRSNEPTSRPSKAELEYQEAQRTKLQLSPEKLQENRRLGIAKGVAIGSAQKTQLAVDANFQGFQAGALTYLLTRYLWQLPNAESLSLTFDRLTLVTRELSNKEGNAQVPLKEVAPGKSLEQSPTYQLNATRPHAEGVVRGIRQDGIIEFWLGGVSSRTLEAFQAGSLFNLMDDQDNVIGVIEQVDRSGLVGGGKLKEGKVPAIGTLIREKLRYLPTDLPLRIGVDPKIGPNQAALAEELSKIKNVQVLPMEQLRSGDLTISPLSEDIRQTRILRCKEGDRCSSQISQPVGSLGLFTLNSDPIAESFGRLNESPKTTIDRLRPQLKMMMARQFLNLILNAESSKLKVDVNLKSQNDKVLQVLSSTGTRSLSSQTPPPPLKPGSKIKLSIKNQENYPIYLAVITLGDNASLTMLSPSNWDAPESASIIEKGEKADLTMTVTGPAGLFEVLVVTSASPLRDTLQGLQTIAQSRKLPSRSYIDFGTDMGSRAAGESDDAVVQATKNLTRDLTRGNLKLDIPGQEPRGLDPKQSGVFSVLLQVS